MYFYNQNSFYRLFFLFFFIFKKKKLGYKKVQWKLSSFFHMNRIKYFFFFIKKVFMYKKYFFCFFLRKMLSFLFMQVKKYYSIFLLNKSSFFCSNYCSFFLKESMFSDSFLLQIEKKNNERSFDSFVLLYYMMLFFKLFYFMFKHSSISYFSLPIKRNKYTILRSPHIDKKSREQFELKHFHLVLNELCFFSLQTNPFLFNFFRFFMTSFKLEEKNDILFNQK